MARIHLSEHFTYKKLFRFVMPSVTMMVFLSIYTIVDGFFVSNFTNELSFAALNLIYPLIMILASIGFMLGVGGNAAVSKKLGEKENEEANRIFSMLIYATMIIGTVLAVVGILIARPIAELFAMNETSLSAGEKRQLLDYCVVYVRIILAALPMFMLQNAFQGFFVTAEKSKLGLCVTVTAGLMNILLDAIFIVGLKMGLVGAALATALSQCTGGILPLFYFFRKNDSLLRLGKTKFNGKVFGEVCFNGLSEFSTNVSLSVVTILYNAQLMRYCGVDGVSAYGVLQYIGFIFIGAFLGYSVGSAPIVGYHYGARNREELENIFKKSLKTLLIVGVGMTLMSILLAKPLSAIFVSKDEELLALTTRGLQLYSLGFLLSGLNIFASSFFTALSNGLHSLMISFSRTFFFQVLAVLLLPLLWNVDGIWLASVVAEFTTLFLTFTLLIAQRKKYGYL